MTFRIPTRFRSIALVALTMLACLGLLAACGGEKPHDPGLIRAPEFTEASGRLARAWQFAHHASSDSYLLSVDDGAASIERVGHEPWARLAQEIDRQRLSEVAGRRMAFSMDLRADLDDSVYGKPIEPTGLMARVWQKPAAGSSMVSAMVGSPRSRDKRLGLAPDAQIPQWERRSVEFSVPENVSRIEVSAILSTGGKLELRNPSLRVIDE